MIEQTKQCKRVDMGLKPFLNGIPAKNRRRIVIAALIIFALLDAYMVYRIVTGKNSYEVEPIEQPVVIAEYGKENG